MGLFEDANEAAVLAAAETLEWTDDEKTGSSADAVPTSTEGATVGRSNRCVVHVKPVSDACDVQIWLFFPQLDGGTWCKIRNASWTADSEGLTERVDCAGASRIYAQLTNFTGAPATTARDYLFSRLPSS